MTSGTSVISTVLFLNKADMQKVFSLIPQQKETLWLLAVKLGLYLPPAKNKNITAQVLDTCNIVIYVWLVF